MHPVTQTKFLSWVHGWVHGNGGSGSDKRQSVEVLRRRIDATGLKCRFHARLSHKPLATS
jgi:hypothetical protein